MDLGHKLDGVTGRQVDLVRIEDAESESSFFADILSEGRVLVDRDNRWPGLLGGVAGLRRRGAERERERTARVLAGIDRLPAAE